MADIRVYEGMVSRGYYIEEEPPTYEYYVGNFDMSELSWLYGKKVRITIEILPRNLETE